MTQHQALARRMWHQLEPVHASLYFAPQAFEEAAALGYDVESRWPSYFAWRAAPLGAVGRELVTATFYSFSPRTIAEYVPAVWATAAPDKVAAARLRAVDRTFRALLGDRVGGPDIAEAAALAKEAAEAAPLAARPLAAANRDLGWSDEPHLALWQATTVLREQRGDSHLAALLTAGLDPCEALVSFAGVGAAPKENFDGRGWTAEEWSAAAGRLVERGWLDADGNATEHGRQGRDAIERQTDELAAAPWRALGAERAERLAELIHPLLAAVFEAGMLPAQSTLGIAAVQVAYA
ncbi:SCO6745 family protein [Streptomyces milbemycinicus]|uniref:SCO6745 family protein n=1 Tax=Streptomyces milbemycinicus TaxID=476552 RepID=UPI0033C58DF4